MKVKIDKNAVLLTIISLCIFNFGLIFTVISFKDLTDFNNRIQGTVIDDAIIKQQDIKWQKIFDFIMFAISGFVLTLSLVNKNTMSKTKLIVLFVIFLELSIVFVLNLYIYMKAFGIVLCIFVIVQSIIYFILDIENTISTLKGNTGNVRDTAIVDN